MCTVSFIPSGNRYFITSNRDEHISRPVAHQPQFESRGGSRVLFPKDPKAGGTWFALNENGVSVVLLNGAFTRHTSNGSYAKSRGLVVLDVAYSNQPKDLLWKMDLNGIEPFTLVVFDNELLEFRWDGSQKYFRPLDPTKNHIWSSATLYRDEVIAQRAQLFNRFMDNNPKAAPDDVVDFHSNNHDDFENGFIINRESGLKTFSVTQAILGEGDLMLRHFDLIENASYEVPFNTTQLTY